MKSRHRSLCLYLAGPALLVTAGVAVCLLLSIPFGPIFETFLHLATAGLVLTLVLPGIRLLKARWLLKPLGFILSIAALSVAALAALVALDYTLIPLSGVDRSMTEEQWREDLDYLAREMPRLHPCLFDLVPEERYRKAISDLEGRISELDRFQIKAEFAKIAALPNDAHTFPNIFSRTLDLHLYPLQIYQFGDRLMVVDAPREHKRAVGKELLEVCGTPVDEVLKKMEPFLSAENESGARLRRVAAMTVAEFLYSSGISDRPDRAVFTFVGDAGERFSINLKAVHYIPAGYWAFGKTVDNTFCPATSGTRRDNYLFEYREDTNTIYVQFNTCYEDEDLSFSGFVNRLSAFVEDHDFDRFVVDVRNNDGGNGEMVIPLAEFIAGNEKVNRAGRLFVIIGRNTFSAAVMFSALLSNTSKAIFVGEPSSQGPVFYSSPNPLTLPNCGMQIAVSTSLTLGSFQCDPRDRISPDIPVDYSWDDYLSGRDPCMEAILAYRHKPLTRPVPGAHALSRYDGRYLIEPYHMAAVERTGSGLSLNVTDFNPHSFQKLRSRLYQVSDSLFQTDLDGVEIYIQPPGEEPAQRLIIVWGGTEMEARRVPGDFALPMELIDQGRKEELIEGLLGDRRDDYAGRIYDLEDFLNSEGYRYMRDGRHEMAIRVFLLNTELFPGSSNVWDSLGEGYMESGQKDLAIQNYEKSLELNPHNENAKKMLRRLK